LRHIYTFVALEKEKARESREERQRETERGQRGGERERKNEERRRKRDGLIDSQAKKKIERL
jgi:hypothetical protein